MINLADLVVVGAIDGGTLKDGRGEFRLGEADVLAVIHCLSSMCCRSMVNACSREGFPFSGRRVAKLRPDAGFLLPNSC
jgi:hypothetical protein